MYWAGRAWQQRGDTAKAQAHWRSVMAKEGASYYSGAQREATQRAGAQRQQSLR
jgi:hypothetical protein